MSGVAWVNINKVTLLKNWITWNKNLLLAKYFCKILLSPNYTVVEPANIKDEEVSTACAII